MPGVYSFLYYIFLVAFFLGLISLVIGIFTLSAAMLASGVSMIVTSLLVNLFLGIWSSTERTATYMRQLVELMKKETSQGSGGES
jgi:membrane protein implicated in regulation of membrane protease activity